jgi:hypothetical protein
MDARRAPERIGECHRADELSNLRPGGRTARAPASGFPSPECAKPLPMRAYDRFGADDVERSLPTRPPVREPHPEGAVEETEPRSPRAMAEQGELLAERKVLKDQIPVRLERGRHGTQKSEHGGHCRPEWSSAFLVVQSREILFWQTTGRPRPVRNRTRHSVIRTARSGGRARSKLAVPRQISRSASEIPAEGRTSEGAAVSPSPYGPT